MSVALTVVIPAYNEGDAIVPVLDRIFDAVESDCEIFVVVDFEEDTTVPVLAAYREHEPRLHTLVNTYGRGPANAIRYGIDQVKTPVVVVTMADGSDDPRQIDPLARLVDRGVVVAAASRYTASGQQVGGPLVKGVLSKTAGRSLKMLARVGTHDATNSFKAYSTDFIREVGIHSRSGFEIGLELTAKARRLRRPVAEVPTIWLDRAIGDSSFDLAGWIPKYLRWYRFAFGPQLSVDEVQREAAEDRRHQQQTHQESASCVSENSKQKVLVSGSAGFIGGYVVEELLRRGYAVVGVDNYSKYGKVEKSYDDHPDYDFYEDDARDVQMMTKLLADCDHFIAGAALIGGISYFHAYAYDLLATNERIMASECDAAIEAHRSGKLKKVTYLSSSMVFESTEHWPSKEGDERRIPPPLSSYGFQKLAVEYFAKAAWDQYQLPYTIVRPFNCVGIGEGRALGDVEVSSGNVKLAMSHVVPDIVQKIVKGQDPLHILGEGHQIRHYTYGGDLARGIVTCMESEAAYNNDFNISTPESTSVRELSEVIWRKIKGDAPLTIVSDPAYEYDVQKRVPDVTKAREVLGFECSTSLDDMLDEVIPWVTQAVADGRL